jgi:hypothetical protein
LARQLRLQAPAIFGADPRAGVNLFPLVGERIDLSGGLFGDHYSYRYDPCCKLREQVEAERAELYKAAGLEFMVHKPFRSPTEFPLKPFDVLACMYLRSRTVRDKPTTYAEAVKQVATYYQWRPAKIYGGSPLHFPDRPIAPGRLLGLRETRLTFNVAVPPALGDTLIVENNGVSHNVVVTSVRQLEDQGHYEVQCIGAPAGVLDRVDPNTLPAILAPRRVFEVEGRSITGRVQAETPVPQQVPRRGANPFAPIQEAISGAVRSVADMIMRPLFASGGRIMPRDFPLIYGQRGLRGEHFSMSVGVDRASGPDETHIIEISSVDLPSVPESPVLRLLRENMDRMTEAMLMTGTSMGEATIAMERFAAAAEQNSFTIERMREIGQSLGRSSRPSPHERLARLAQRIEPDRFHRITQSHQRSLLSRQLACDDAVREAYSSRIGGQTVMFRGMPIITDPNITTGQVYMDTANGRVILGIKNLVPDAPDKEPDTVKYRGRRRLYKMPRAKKAP